MSETAGSTAKVERPERTANYTGPRTDTSRWAAYEPREGDIFICTPPKCGTTWTQAICALLIFRRRDFRGQLDTISPWFDSTGVPLDTCVRTLAAQSHRRFIKTHTPLDAVPYRDDATYLAVYRDPRDAFFSLRSHLKNAASAQAIPQTDPDPKIGFVAWLEETFRAGAAEQRSLEFFVHHFRSYKRFATLPNLHFLHYADYQRDLPGNVLKIAGILGIDIDLAEAQELAQAASFEHMKNNPRTFAPSFGRGVWKNDAAFFSKGQNAQWHGIIDGALMGHYEQRIGQLLSPADKHWLENGTPG